MPNRRSDSHVPRPQLGAHHPPLHRMNNAAHEFGMPYQIKRFTTSTPNISLVEQPSSDDSLHTPSLSKTSQPSSQPNELSTSVPGNSWMQSPSYQQSPNDGTLPTFSSADFLQPRVETSFVNNAVSSPGNQSRYSMSDFSKFQWSDIPTNSMYSQPTFAASADQLGTSNYSDWSLDTPQYSQSNTTLQTPQQRLSVASVDQPGLTHSPSNTVSEASSSAYPSDTSYPNFGSQPPRTINPSYTSKDYFGPHNLDPVSENTGALSTESFVFRPEATISTEDLFGAGPGPAEPMIKSEPQDFCMEESFTNTDNFTSSIAGPSLVVPQFTDTMGTTGSYVDQYQGPTSAGHQQPPQYFDESMGGEFAWDISQQQNM